MIELLVVIGIIGILVSVGTVSFTAAQARSRDAKRRGDLTAIKNALEQYYAENNGNYPLTGECAGYEDYLASGVPIDPKFGFAYADPGGNNLSGGSGGFCDALGSSYCLCVQLEVEGSGNASGRSGSVCNYGGAAKDYFCVSNLQ